MSEHQTTAERIEKQLNDIHDTYPGSVYDCFRVIAKELATEIDARDKRIAEIEVADGTTIMLMEAKAKAWDARESLRIVIEGFPLVWTPENRETAHNMAVKVAMADGRAREAARVAK